MIKKNLNRNNNIKPTNNERPKAKYLLINLLLILGDIFCQRSISDSAEKRKNLVYSQ